jgi:branched-chain amino acid transport system ATP-binding protein
MRASPKSTSGAGMSKGWPVLELARVSAAYGAFQALFDIDMAVSAGEAVAVIGPNGAGKTTLMRVISGLIRPRSGSITFDGQTIGGKRAHQVVSTGIAHVPENRRLFPRLSVEENLKIGAFVPAARARLAGRLAWVYDLFPPLRERRNQLAGTLSGGEQQMCAIGRALMSGPKLLLMDEPSAGLAPVVVDQVFDLVLRIRKEGFTVLIVEQNVQGVLDVVDRAYLLEVGTIKLAGTAAELREHPFVRRAYLGI